MNAIAVQWVYISILKNILQVQPDIAELDHVDKNLTVLTEGEWVYVSVVHWLQWLSNNAVQLLLPCAIISTSVTVGQTWHYWRSLQYSYWLVHCDLTSLLSPPGPSHCHTSFPSVTINTSGEQSAGESGIWHDWCTSGYDFVFSVHCLSWTWQLSLDCYTMPSPPP